MPGCVCQPRRHSGEGRNPRLQGCTPAWMQVVEPRLEQAAEVVERRWEQAAEEGWAGMLDGLRFLPACRNNASVVIPT